MSNNQERVEAGEPDLFNQQIDDEPAGDAPGATPEPCPHCGRAMGVLEGSKGAKGRRPTSRAAAEINRDTDQHRVLRVLRTLGPATADAVAAEVKRSPNQTAARLLALRDGGYVRHTTENGEYVLRLTRTGSKAQVQELTPAGFAALARLDRTT